MNIYDFTVATADEGTQAIADYKDQALLIVNVASKCGYTPQYEGLEALHREYKNRGLKVLGFPSNQFGEQEPGTDDEIVDFCTTNYAVTFPVFAKIDVNGDDADPLYRYLRSEAPGNFGPEAGFLFEHLAKTRPEVLDSDEIKWNFTKFLVGRDGEVLKRYESAVTPEELRTDVDTILNENP